MEIGKKDVVGFVNSLTYDSHKHKNSRNNTHLKSERYDDGKFSSQVQLDQIRSKAMRLDDEIKEYQTLITNYQMQSGFLEDIGEHDGWYAQLLKFLKEVISFKKEEFVANIPEDISFTSYQRELQERIDLYRKKMGRGEVQLQNIFASGLLVDPEINRNLADIKDGKGLFKNLRSSTIHNLLS